MAIEGILIRNFKSYHNVEYVDFVANSETYFSTILGKNGVGKSTILQALDFYFNKDDSTRWIQNNNARTNDDGYVSALFSVPVNDWEDFVHTECKQNADTLLDETKNIDNSLRSFFSGGENIDAEAKPAERTGAAINTAALVKNKHKKSLSSSNYYLWVNVDRNGDVNESPVVSKSANLNVLTLYKALIQYHTFIYIPADSDPNVYLKLTSSNVSKVLDESSTEKITEIIEKRKVSSDDNAQTLIEFLNSQLDNYVESINRNLAKSQSAFEFNTPKRSHLSAGDLSLQIVKNYFETRTLYNREKLPVTDLSSGEQRQAVIDVLSSLIKSRKLRDDEMGRTIIGIDEPELSQDTANVFGGFERLEELATQYRQQVLITTHWYGVLPTIRSGGLVVVEHEKSSTTFTEKIDDIFSTSHSRALPADIYLKSFFDLSNSLVAYVRAHPNRFLLLCEGESDKLYLESILDSEKVRVFVVGGKSNVLKIASLLTQSERLKSDLLTGKQLRIACIVDTDYVEADTAYIYNSAHIRAVRWQLTKLEENTKVSLVRLNKEGVGIIPTAIEDVQDSNLFMQALNQVIGTMRPYDHLRFNKDWAFSNLRNPNKGTEVMLNIIGENGEKQKDDLRDFISENKMKIAKMYANIVETKIQDGTLNVETSPLVSEIERLFGVSGLGKQQFLTHDQIGYLQERGPAFFYQAAYDQNTFVVAKDSICNLSANARVSGLAGDVKNKIRDIILSDRVESLADGRSRFKRDFEISGLSYYQVGTLLEGKRFRTRNFGAYFKRINISTFNKLINQSKSED